MKHFCLVILFALLLSSEFVNSLPKKDKGKKSSSFSKKLKTAAIIGGSAFVGYKAAKLTTKLTSMNLGKTIFWLLIWLNWWIVFIVSKFVSSHYIAVVIYCMNVNGNWNISLLVALFHLIEKTNLSRLNNTENSTI